APVPGGAVIDDGELGPIGDAQADLREDTAQLLSQGDVDGLPLGPAAVAVAAVGEVTAQRAVVRGVAAARHPTGQALDDGHALFPGIQRLQGLRQRVAIQRLRHQLVALLGSLDDGYLTTLDLDALAADPERLNLLPGQAVSFDHEDKPLRSRS